MRASLVINGTEFGHYIPEDGLSFSTDRRNERTVVTLDGTKWMTYKEKINISATLLDMPDDIYKTLMTAIKMANPASISVSNFDTGETATGYYYITDHPYTVNQSIGTLTYLNSLSLTLEEK